MAEGDCLKIGEKEFCYSRKSPCPCSKKHKYQDHNKDKVESWGKYLQKQAPKVKGNKQLVARLEAVARSAEHHHILCVSAIEQFLAIGQAFSHAKATTWCINQKKNMIALPMWAMHLMHYCYLSNATPAMKEQKTSYPGVKSFQSATVAPPPFDNLPMHDQDHDLYIKEVDTDLEEVASELPLVEACKDPESSLKQEFERLMEKYSLQLVENGSSMGGTHRNWEKGLNQPESDWYKPFSMSREPRPRIHPSAGGEFADKMNELHAAFWLEDNPAVFHE